MSSPLSRLVDEAALARPEAPAIRCGETTLTYEELARRSNGLARVLLDHGLAKSDRVAVLLAKGAAVPVGFYGTLTAGGTLVPIDPRSPTERVAGILAATGATHLVTEPGLEDVARGAIAASPGTATIIGLEDGATPWGVVHEEASDRPPPIETGDLDPAYILHTSGSTGAPKLILHTHRSALAFVDWATAEYELTPWDRLSNHSSHHTCFATFDFYAAARAAATTVILTPAEMMMPASLATVLERERVSVWYSVPTALVHLSLRGDLAARDLAALRWVLFAGESFPPKHLQRLMRQLPRARFSHVYGSTEVNVCTFHHLAAGDEAAGPLPIGRACSTAETLVVDDDLRPVAAGEVGELLVRGSTVMSGYWCDEEGSRRALVRPAGDDGRAAYFRTGDRVRTLADGTLTFVTRGDDQVKVRGHRVELEEVETALLALDAVEEAAAYAVADGEGSSALRAAVVIGRDEGPTRETLRTALARVLPSYALPAEIEVRPSLPRTHTGKVDRNALRASATE